MSAWSRYHVLAPKYLMQPPHGPPPPHGPLPPHGPPPPHMPPPPLQVPTLPLLVKNPLSKADSDCISYCKPLKGLISTL